MGKWGYEEVISFVMDGSRFWLKDVDECIYGWDFEILGSPPVKLSTQAPKTLHLNNIRLWDNRQYRIQDTVTGKVVFQLPEQYQSYVVEVQWNGQYLVISLRFKKELILEFPHAFLSRDL